MNLRSLLAVLPFLTLSHGVAEASSLIYARFGGSPGSDPWDQYTGAAGGGWAGAWSQKNSSGDAATISASVVTSPADPLVPGQNYLQANYAIAGADATTRRAGISRQWDKLTVTPTSNYSVSFSVRYDDLTAFTTAGNKAVLFGATTSDRSNQSISISNTLWLIQLYPDNKGWGVIKRDSESSPATTFYFGTDNVPILADTVYTFKIDVFATTGEYDVTINDVSASSLRSGELFKLGAGNISDFTWLNWQVAMNSESSEGVSFSYDLSNVTIEAVPEPGMASLALGGVAALGMWARIKSRRKPFHG